MHIIKLPRTVRDSPTLAKQPRIFQHLLPSVSFWIILNKDTRDTACPCRTFVTWHRGQSSIPSESSHGKIYCFSESQFHLHVHICMGSEERMWNQTEEKFTCSAPNSVCSQSKHSRRCKSLFGFPSRMRYYYIHLYLTPDYWYLIRKEGSEQFCTKKEAKEAVKGQ